MPSWLWEVIGRVADIGSIIALLVLIASAVGWLIRRLHRGAVGADSVVPYLIALSIAELCSLSAGLARLWLGYEDLLAVTLVVAGVAGALAGCAYLAFRRRPTGPLGTLWEPAHPRARPFALAGLVLILLLTLGGLVGWWYVRSLPPQKAIILVANFQREGTNRDDYQFTGLLLERLRNALAGETKVEVQAMRRAITAQEGITAARREGERRKAAVVIWGWYGVPPGATTAVVSVHFEVLREPKGMPPLEIEEPRLVALAQLESFAFQTQLSREMVYLTAFTVGMGRYAAAEWEGAIRSFTTALAQTEEPVRTLDNSVVCFYRGSAHDNLGQYEQAIADYDQAITLQPDLAEAYTNRGADYGEQNQYQRAITDFDRAIALKPDDALAYYNRGLAYAEQGQYEQAIADLDRAITLQPDLAMAYNNRGGAYDDLGQYQRAIADYTQAIKLKPDFAAAYNNRGRIYAKQGQYQRAIADFDRAIALKPDFAEAYVVRGAVYGKQGQYKQAIADLDRAIALQPDYAGAYYNRGLAYKLMGEKAKAAADFRKVLELTNDAALRRQAEEELKGLE